MMAKTVVCDLLQIFKSSVLAVLPENLIRKSMKYNPTHQLLTIVGENYNLLDKNVYVVGTGKAVQNIAFEVESILESKIKKGIISIPEGSTKEHTSKNVYYYEGARNNLPDSNAEATSKKVRDLATSLDKDDLLLVLISGGGSALLSLPKEPISLQEKIDLIKCLANSGADIKELNTVRKKLSDIKGGRLAIKAQPAKVISLILSDVVGDPMDLIASGPTVRDMDDNTKAVDVIRKYKLIDKIPDSIRTVLNTTEESKAFPDDNIINHIIGSNKLSIEAAVNEATKLNYKPVALSNGITGNVNLIAKKYTELVQVFCKFLSQKINKEDVKTQLLALDLPSLNLNLDDLNCIEDKDVCLILGGETTVEVKGSGKGGRNQQLPLEFSKYIHESKDSIGNFDVYLLSAGTDGIDGPTDAAGAIGYRDLITESMKEGMDVDRYLQENDSYNFYKEFNNGNLHVITGHTNTNVMDIHLILIKRVR